MDGGCLTNLIIDNSLSITLEIRKRTVRRPTRINGSAGETRFGRAVSPLGSGAAVQLVWAGTLATLLWVAAAWAMGWLP